MGSHIRLRRSGWRNGYAQMSTAPISHCAADLAQYNILYRRVYEMTCAIQGYAQSDCRRCGVSWRHA
jgi:hypothetical protein